MLSDKCHKCYAEPLFSLNVKVEGRGEHINGNGGGGEGQGPCLIGFFSDKTIGNLRTTTKFTTTTTSVD